MSNQATPVDDIASIDDAMNKTYLPGFGGQVVLSDERVVDILQCRVKHIGPIARFIREAFDILDVVKLEDLSNVPLQDPEVFLKLISEGSDSLFIVGAMLCEMSVAEFSDLPIDDATLILLEEFEVNKGFFTSKVIPIVASRFGSPTPEEVEKATNPQ